MRSLQARMFLVFALIATLPLLALSYLTLSEARSALAEEVGAAQRDAAQAAAGFVDVYVENARVLLDTESRSPLLLAAVETNDSDALASSVRGLQERSVYRDTPLFRAVLLLDERGRVIASHPPDAARLGDDHAGTSVFIATRGTGELSVLPVVPGTDPVLPMGAPVFVDSETRAVLVAHLGLRALGERLRAFAPGEGQEILLADRAGRVIAHPNASLVTDRPDWGDAAPVALGRTGEPGFLVYEHPRTGESSLGAYASIPRRGWVLVSTVPTDVAYEGLSRLTAVLVVLSGILVGTILLASVLVARRIVKPVEELTAAAGALSAGRLNTRIAPRSSDEIGELARAFNEMAKRIGESLDGLRRSEARYRSLVESANDLIFTIQPDGTLSFVSPLARAMLGREPATLLGTPAHGVVADGDRMQFVETVRRVLERGEPVLWVPCRLLDAEGATRTVLINFSPIFEQGDRPARVLGVAHDVTLERRQQLIRDKAFQMARLVSEQAALEPLVNRGLALLLAVVSVDRGVAYILDGVAMREVATANLDRAPPAARAQLRDLAHEAAQLGAPVRREADGASALALPLVEQGDALGAVVLLGDARSFEGESLEVLTALASQLAVGLRRTLFEARLKEHAAELESRVRERTAELTEKSREMEGFLYSVSHDLKAPLISIQGYADSLAEDYGRALGGDGALYLERIRSNAGLMESLILDILELSRIGRVREAVTTVDMDDLLREVASRVADRFAESGGAVAVAPGLPPVVGERKRLAQAFANLLDNAHKYRHPGRPPRVAVTAARRDGEVEFRVADNGRGIPRDAMPRLFQIFQRVATPGMEDPGGTGMGLAIVKRIVETQGGRVDIESVEGEGTTFVLTFPAAGARQG